MHILWNFFISMTLVLFDFVKRLIDIVVAMVAIVLLSPVLLIVALAVMQQLGSPVLFLQWRPGKNGQLFRMVKFRTMTSGDTADELRLTAFGKKLRASSLDELPELFNVLLGQMSLVGPRPLLVQYLDLYNPRQSRRHEVRPGITGLAQVSGRNQLAWPERFELDVQYVERRSLRLDLGIVARTIASVLSREGISASDHATSPPFLGNQVSAESAPAKS